MDPAAAFAAVAAQQPRCFWLDGGGARDWSGRRSLVGWLEPSDVSLTYSAATGVVTRHVDGRSEPIGSDVFEVLEAELAAGSPTDQWFGYFGYPCRPDLPALVSAPGADVPDAVWMRPSQLRFFDHPALSEHPAGRGSLLVSGVATPDRSRNTLPAGYPDTMDRIVGTGRAEP